MAASAAPETVLVRSGAVTITEADLHAELQRAPEQAREGALRNKQTMQMILRNLMARRLLSNEARAAGLADASPLREQLRLAEERVLSDAQMQKFSAAEELTDAELQTYAKTVYAAQPERFTAPAQTHARHILIEGDSEASKAEAEKLLMQIRGGANFEELAKAHSQDKGSAVRGGDLGTFPEGKMVPEFDAALKELKNPGDVSEPVKTKFGWHLIQLVARTAAHQRSFDEVKDQLMQEGRAEVMKRHRTAMVDRLLSGIQVRQEAVDAFVAKEKP